MGHTTSGVYHVTPLGTRFGYDVYCDMETDNGGWLVKLLVFSNTFLEEKRVRMPHSSQPNYPLRLLMIIRLSTHTHTCTHRFHENPLFNYQKADNKIFVCKFSKNVKSKL